MKPFVSVILPVYNGSGFVARAIQSALDQTTVAREIIVVDDGSTDDTLMILHGFGTRIRVISTENGGAAAARNLGIRAACGNMIAFLDADDEWDNDKLERQLAVLTAHPEVGFCCANFRARHPVTGQRLNHFSQFAGDPAFVTDTVLPGDQFDLLLRANIVGTCSNVLVRRSVLDAVGLFNIAYRQAEDYDLWLRCALVTRFYILGASMLTKHTHGTNLTNDAVDMYGCHERVLQQLVTSRPDLLACGARRHTCRKALADARYQLGNRLFERGQRGAAFACFIRAFGADRTLPNLQRFLYFFSRKAIRVLSFNVVRNVASQ